MEVIKSYGLRLQPNTEAAFTAALNAGFTRLGPSVMVTKNGDILLNHDDVVLEGTAKVHIRKLTRAQIEGMTINQVINDHDYGQPNKYLFLDRFLDLYADKLDLIFLDIKNTLFSGVSSRLTAQKLIRCLRMYMDVNEVDLWDKLYFDSDNPFVVKDCIQEARKYNLHLRAMYDYNTFGVRLCDPCYDCIFGWFNAVTRAPGIALQGHFATQKRINRYKSSGRCVVVWDLPLDYARTLINVDFVLV